MAGSSSTPRPHVVVAGGGVAALEALLTIDELARSRLRLTVLAAEPTFHYLPLLVTEAFSGGHAYRLELAGLVEPLGAELRVGVLDTVEAGARRIGLADGASLRFDALLVAIGARRRGTLPGAITFAGRKASADLRGVLKRAAEGGMGRLVYAVPPGVKWTLPAYELALTTAAHFERHAIATEVMVVSHEPTPLAVFGGEASAAIAAQLRAREVEFRQAETLRVEPARLVVAGGEQLAADAVVALPRLFAPEIDGLASDENGFLPVDERCRVIGSPAVYAAGDATSSPLKQGGIAAQQAEVAARAMLADLGLGPEPEPFRPLFRGLMLAGPPPDYRRLDPDAVSGASRGAARGGADGGDSLPRAKIAGRHVAAYLARHGIPLGGPPNTVALELEGSDPDPPARRA